MSGFRPGYSPEIEKRYEKEARKTEYSDGKYSVLMPHDANEIINEGRMLQHCVGNAGYIRKMAEGLCTILFLRDNRDLAAPLITMEECDGSIVQCYGFRDKYNSSPEIREFIKDYASRRNLKINAVIYR
ncbi:MAG: PcfJ domain-containing protein [Lachnospiraceae bacterium]|nr:PcfJ domain-containing protein [Lachnospiraceae bacterium]